MAIREHSMTESEAIIAHWLSPEAMSVGETSLSNTERRPRMLFATDPAPDPAVPDPVPVIMEC